MVAPPPELSVSQWADRYRKLSSESSAEPGQWDTDRAPYQRGIMDAVNDPSVLEIWVKKSAQIGWTEILGNVAGYYMHQDPSPMLLIQPTGGMADAWSKDRLGPMLRDTPVLRGKVKDERTRKSDRGERGNTIKHKRFPGGSLSIIGSNSPAALASRPIRIILFDEIDRYPVNVGKLAQREGNVVSLAKKRTTTFWNRKILGGSTPTIEGISEIDMRYLNSDQRKFFVPCPFCKKAQFLVWSNVKWDRAKDGAHLPETAYYMCVKCGERIQEKHKLSMLRSGEWRSTAPFTGIAGFHIWEAYSPWVSYAQMAKLFLTARQKPEDFQTFINTSLGETWREGTAIDPKSLPGRVELYDQTNIPGGVLLLTMGVDTQDDRLHVELWGWGKGEENWQIAQFVIRGDPSQPEVWKDLDRLISTKWPIEDGRRLYVEGVCVDSGGHHTQTVYNYCLRRKKYRVFATKGSAGTGRLAWPKHPSQIKESQAEVFVIGVDTIKDVLFTRLTKVTEAGNPGYTHFSAGCDERYFKQLTGEVVVVKYIQGKHVRYWVPKAKNVPLEPLDCWVYAFAAKEARAADLDAREAARIANVEKKTEEHQQIPLVGMVQAKRRMVRNSGVRL